MMTQKDAKKAKKKFDKKLMCIKYIFCIFETIKLKRMRRLLYSCVGLLLIFASTNAQLLIWTPNFPADADAITITMDAAKGNKGLLNYSNPNDVYVHIGVTTNLSANGGQEWKYVNGTSGAAWGTQVAAIKAVSIGNNQYTYTISNIRSFFGVPAAEVITNIGVLFRNGNGTLVQRNTDGSDMFIPIYSSAAAIRFTQPPFQPTFARIVEPITKNVGETLALAAVSNKAVTLNIYQNGIVIKTETSATSIAVTATLNTTGTTTFIAEMVDGSTVKKDTFSVFISGSIDVAALPAGLRDGINYLPNNSSVILVLRAPLKNRVAVIGDFPNSNWIENTAYQMKKTPDGNFWWLQIDNLTPGTEYAFQYLVDGTLKVADPYTEKILSTEDAGITAVTYPNLKAYPTGKTTGNVAIVKTGGQPYVWQATNYTKPDKKNLLIYEVLVRDFVGTHSWQAMIDTLSYLRRLGINAVELMPVMEFEGNESWGYNTSFSFAADKYYGNSDLLKAFIDSCHKSNIVVLLDIVPNHVYSQSPLAQLYWNASASRPAANNPWLNEVQPHAFGFGQDFNHESAATKYYWHRVFDYWLREYKVDGYRLDFTKGLTQVPSSNDAVFSAYDQSRINILSAYADTIWKNFPSSYLILEHLASTSEEVALQNKGFLMWGGKRDHERYSEAAMGYHDNNKSNFSSTIYNSPERGFTNPHLVGYMESHDEERLMYKNKTFGNGTSGYSVKTDSIALRRMEAASALFFTIPGPKMIWQFGERGYDKSIFACPDGTIPLPYASNENCKLSNKDPHWEYMQQANNKRLFAVNAALIQLRKSQTELFNSSNFTYNLGGEIKYFQIQSPTLSATIVANFGVLAGNATVTFPEAGTWYSYLEGSTINATGAAQTIPLQAGQYHVYLNKNITNIISTPIFNINRPVYSLKVETFPNPIAPSSQLEVEIPENAFTTIHLINVAGQTLRTLAQRNFTKGVHRISLNTSVQGLPAGMYFIKVVSGTQLGMSKIVIH